MWLKQEMGVADDRAWFGKSQVKQSLSKRQGTASAFYHQVQVKSFNSLKKNEHLVKEC